ncbi:amidohydrolase [Ilyomonas limi]|uniref:Amidohydrolase n=1 Tax=Ilyomonas limi TaxID=2575867 RepID=A0A4U3L8P1_9BACT|nr:amidohydrolase family protein [Ilyomonas limi]TKK71638.1 amidohydrolase [Ilyomonas limi]
MKKYRLLCWCLCLFMAASAQETFPVNGVHDYRTNYFAFTHATVVKDSKTTIPNATLIIKEGKIISIENGGAVPKDAAVIDCKGKYIYPSFIDLYSDYGVAPQEQPQRSGFSQQMVSNTKGAYGWNQAIRPETDASKLFKVNDDKAKDLRSMGFGTVVSHVQDGIARGTGTLVTLSDDKENMDMLKDKAAAFYSFNKGSSTQDYPTSLMGAIALLRQTYLDAQWYKNLTPVQKEKSTSEGTNLSLEAWNNNQSLPQIFDAADKWNVLRAQKIANEFGVPYILRGGGNEYQRMDEMKATKASFILPLNFPDAIDVEDPNAVRLVALSVMKHWEMAPLEPGMFDKAGLNFTLTASGTTSKEFLQNLRKAIDNGLSTTKALDALTKTPATLIGVYDKIGSLDAGKLANFIIATGPIFEDSTVFLQNWIQGKKFIIDDAGWNDYRGNYKLTVKQPNQTKEYTVEVGGKPGKISATLKASGDTAKTDIKINILNNSVNLSWSNKTDSSKVNHLTGIISGNTWVGTGYAANGEPLTWNMLYNSAYIAKADTAKKDTAKKQDINKTVYYPFNGYGFAEMPKQEDILIKNATVWTNESAGILPNTDVLIKGGKIAAIGKNISASGTKQIDATGKYLSPGIIDEHSHIAITGGVNECSQSVTSEVRVADVIDPEDIQIYRQLSDGVTSAHLLHGSCNTIGGQTQLIKMRWGKDAEDLKFADWDPFIKFALGENVKRTFVNNNNRFPDTRMGVEQVLVDAFTRAEDYQKMDANKRRDLELDALSEILHHKRFITCHSYVQSEINMLLHVADSFNFTVNTFTHILEGYKMADKMKAHGAYASTFSDWWAYKAEVQDAIPYNIALMTDVGLTVAVNSDDPEQARHLNQEAAKSIKYGGLSEEQAFKTCTLNPATMLHIADRVGSIKVGKDADVVLWNANPLSVYATVEKTWVDGIEYFDRGRDSIMRTRIAAERNRLIQKMLTAKKGGAKTTPAVLTPDVINECEEDRRVSSGIQ